MMSTLQNLMTPTLKIIRADATIQEAARRMRDERIGSLLVERDGQIIAVVTETDIVRKASARGADLGKEKIESIMTAPVVSIEAQRSPQDAHDMMGDLGVRHLAVTEKGKIVGVLSVRDLLIYYKSVSEPRITQD
jgi:signal-transduction protein with cAMP-binding, CBS, and nucleotidyltransferase domain